MRCGGSSGVSRCPYNWSNSSIRSMKRTTALLTRYLLQQSHQTESGSPCIRRQRQNGAADQLGPRYAIGAAPSRGRRCKAATADPRIQADDSLLRRRRSRLGPFFESQGTASWRGRKYGWPLLSFDGISQCFYLFRPNRSSYRIRTAYKLGRDCN